MPPDLTALAPPDHYIIALRPCGCLAFSVADLPGLRADAAGLMAQALMGGMTPGYVPAGKLADLQAECPICREARRIDAPPTLYDCLDPKAPRVLVTGALTYRVTVPVRVVVATDEPDEERIGDLVFAALKPTTLYADPERLEIEHDPAADDEPLAYAPAPRAWPQVVADQHALPLGLDGARAPT